MNILLIILIIIAIPFVLALFIRKQYTIEREIIVSKNRHEVFNYVKLLKNQAYYNKWVMMDPNVKRDYRGTDGTIGFVTTWDSDNKNVGKGEQEIKSIIPEERVDLQVRFEKPFKNTADVFMTTDSVSQNQTKVTWVMEGENKYPMNLMNLFIPGMLGKDMQTSLTTLKSNLEK